MLARFTKFFQVAALFAVSLSVHAETTVLHAISDFTNIDSGDVPYYVEIVGGRNALAINAANESYREKFARAEHEYLGPTGIYDITIHALGEIDGDGTYRLLVNGVVQGEVVNTPVDVDYTVIEHTFESVALSQAAIIAVESKAVSNDLIPEGDGFAFARGRWRAVSLELSNSEVQAPDAVVDLGISLSTVKTQTNQGDQPPIVASISNNSSTTIATGLYLEIELPEGVEFSSSDICNATGQSVKCWLPELPPGGVVNASIQADVVGTGWFNVSAAISSDQSDSTTDNNFANLAFESMPTSAPIESSTTSNTGTAPTTATPTNTATGANNSATVEPVEEVVLAEASSTSKVDDTIGALSAQSALMLILLGLLKIGQRSLLRRR